MAEAPEICCHRLGCTFETTWIQTTSGHTSWSEKSAVQNGNHFTPRIVREIKNVPTKPVEILSCGWMFLWSFLAPGSSNFKLPPHYGSENYWAREDLAAQNGGRTCWGSPANWFVTCQESGSFFVRVNQRLSSLSFQKTWIKNNKLKNSCFLCWTFLTFQWIRKSSHGRQRHIDYKFGSTCPFQGWTLWVVEDSSSHKGYSICCQKAAIFNKSFVDLWDKSADWHDVDKPFSLNSRNTWKSTIFKS